MVWSRVKLTSLPPAAAISKSGSQISSAPSSGRRAREEFYEPAVGDIEPSASSSCRRISTVTSLGDRPTRCAWPPMPPRAALDAVADGCEQLLRPIAQGLFDDRVSLFFPQFRTQCPQHRHQDLGLDTRLVQER
jgi:hypothetical protein